jgi:hypothetical protein
VKSNKEKTQELAKHAETLVQQLEGRLIEIKDESTSTEIEQLGKRVETILTYKFPRQM